MRKVCKTIRSVFIIFNVSLNVPNLLLLSTTSRRIRPPFMVPLIEYNEAGCICSICYCANKENTHINYIAVWLMEKSFLTTFSENMRNSENFPAPLIIQETSILPKIASFYYYLIIFFPVKAEMLYFSKIKKGDQKGDHLKRYFHLKWKKFFEFSKNSARFKSK